jgi:hypothetical protein
MLAIVFMTPILPVLFKYCYISLFICFHKLFSVCWWIFKSWTQEPIQTVFQLGSSCYGTGFLHLWRLAKNVDNYIDGRGFVSRVAPLVTHVKQELLTLPELMSSPPVVSAVRVARSLVLCVVF